MDFWLQMVEYLPAGREGIDIVQNSDPHDSFGLMQDQFSVNPDAKEKDESFGSPSAASAAQPKSNQGLTVGL